MQHATCNRQRTTHFAFKPYIVYNLACGNLSLLLQRLLCAFCIIFHQMLLHKSLAAATAAAAATVARAACC